MATPIDDFIDHGDGTATHLVTGLMWKVVRRVCPGTSAVRGAGKRMRLVQGAVATLLADYGARVDLCSRAGGDEAKRAYEAMLTMQKIEVAAIEARSG